MLLFYITVLAESKKDKTFDNVQNSSRKHIIKNKRSIQSFKKLFLMKTLLLSNDSHLVQEFKNGNDKALEVLIWRHKEKVFSSILFLLRDKYLAEDLFQDTFIKIIDTIKNDSYTEEGRFQAFAIRVAHNICVDHFRK